MLWSSSSLFSSLLPSQALVLIVFIIHCCCIHEIDSAFVSLHSAMSLPYSTSSSSPTSVAVTMNPTQEQEDPVPRKQHKQHDSPRDCILRVGASAGRLCSVANTPSVKEISSSSSGSSGNHTELVSAMTDVLHDVWKTSRAVEVDLLEAIRYKLELNIKKYPVEHCKVSSSHAHKHTINQSNKQTKKNTAVS